MDFAGESRSLHLARRLLAVATLVALLGLALASGSAHAQAVAPPDTAPDVTVADQTAPDQTVDDTDWDDDDGYDGRQPHWSPDDHGGTRPGQPGAHILPDTDDDGFDTPEEEELAPVSTSFVAGKQARMRTDGKAAIPRGAPKRVRSLISRYNRIVGKRYKWGGGHAKLVDTGYDCSGAVGYGLIKGGMLRTTMVSGSFARWGAAGAGRWVTIYAHKSHVYIEVAGLRLDTSSAGDRGGRSGVHWRPVIGQRNGFKVRHPVGL
jgi:hypothetical protein